MHVVLFIGLWVGCANFGVPSPDAESEEREAEVNAPEEDTFLFDVPEDTDVDESSTQTPGPEAGDTSGVDTDSPAGPASGMPVNACMNTSGSRQGCANAAIIGRTIASVQWDSGRENTCRGRNRHSGECGGVWDVGNDHTYALFMKAGETAEVSLGVERSKCDSRDYDYHARLKFKFHADPTVGGVSSCPRFESCHPGPNAGQNTRNERSYTASEDGWLFIIVDGGSSGLGNHQGYYNLAVTLSGCLDANCGC